jgi:periplasmic protein TonB
MIASTPRERIAGMAGALLVQAAILAALVYGLAMSAPKVVSDQIILFATAPEPSPPPPVIPPKHRTKGKEGAASPANIKSVATEVVAPAPIVPPVVPPPIIAAPRPNIGAEASQGAAPVHGPGSGAGGIGNGTGSGGKGNGDGGGDLDTPPRWIKGRLKDSDYPRELGASGIGGTVEVRFAVEADGTVDDCRVTRSSRNAVLDATTCRLIVQRYRYKPSLDEDGQPVKSYIVESHSWDVEDEPPDPPAERR